MVRPRIPLSLRPALGDWYSRGLITGESLGLSGGLVDPAKTVLPQKEEHRKVSKIQDIKNKILKNNAKNRGRLYDQQPASPCSHPWTRSPRASSWLWTVI